MSVEHRRLAFFAFALGGFSLGLTEFVTLGLLPQIAHSLLPGLTRIDRGEALAHAGWGVSAYALGVVVGAPTLAVATARMAPNKVLVALLLALATGTVLTALAPNLGLLLGARFLAGLPHGAYFGVAGLLAADMIGPGARSRGYAIVLSGLTIANIVGVPAITRLGQLTSWRVAFAVVAGFFLLTAVLVRLSVPEARPSPDASPSGELRALRSPAVWRSVGVAAIGMAGFFTVYSYLVPVTTHTAHLSASVAPWVLATVGLGMTVGNALGGLSADRRPLQSLLGGLLALVAAMAAFALLASRPAGLFLTAFAVGAAALFLSPALQALLIRASPRALLIGPALNQSAVNVANALGALAGGAVLSVGLPYAATGWVGAGLALGGLVLAAASVRAMPGQAETR